MVHMDNCINPKLINTLQENEEHELATILKEEQENASKNDMIKQNDLLLKQEEEVAGHW